MIFGINWHKDTIIGSYPVFFGDKGLRNIFGAHLKGLLGKTGYLRYPGGEYVQSLPVTLDDAQPDMKYPGFPAFHDFCQEFDIRVMQQLPTFGATVKGLRRTVRSSPGGQIDWDTAGIIVDSAVSMTEWIIKKGYARNIILWEIGNEDWHDIEGRITPVEYVEFVSRYIQKTAGLIPKEKLLIAAQPGRRGLSSNWGHDVLKLLEARGLSGSIGGVSMHIYPYFRDRKRHDSPGFDFNTYALGPSLPGFFKDEFLQLTKALDALGYGSSVKVHVTEFSVEIAGPPREDGFQTFGHNRKNFASALGLLRSMMAVVSNPRFGGGAYYCLTHKYLVAPEQYNQTEWKGYTKADDWGWGQCWYLLTFNKFLNTPLLEMYSLLLAFFENASVVKDISLKEPFKSWIALSEDRGVRLLVQNTLNMQAEITLKGQTRSVLLGDGDLDRRVILPGSFGDEKDISPLKPVSVGQRVLNIPEYAVLYAEGEELSINGVRLVAALKGTQATFAGKELPIGTFSVELRDGRLRPYPEGARIDGYPLTMIKGFEGLSEEDIALRLFGRKLSEIEEWSISDEDV